EVVAEHRRHAVARGARGRENVRPLVGFEVGTRADGVTRETFHEPAEVAQQRPRRDAVEAHVEEEQVEPILGQGRERRRAVSGAHELELLAGEAGERRRVLVPVLDHQDPHAAPSTSGSWTTTTLSPAEPSTWSVPP